jgi:hypothetical protein
VTVVNFSESSKWFSQIESFAGTLISGSSAVFSVLSSSSLAGISPFWKWEWEPSIIALTDFNRSSRSAFLASRICCQLDNTPFETVPPFEFRSGLCVLVPWDIPQLSSVVLFSVYGIQWGTPFNQSPSLRPGTLQALIGVESQLFGSRSFVCSFVWVDSVPSCEQRSIIHRRDFDWSLGASKIPDRKSFAFVGQNFEGKNKSSVLSDPRKSRNRNRRRRRGSHVLLLSDSDDTMSNDTSSHTTCPDASVSASFPHLPRQQSSQNTAPRRQKR